MFVNLTTEFCHIFAKNRFQMKNEMFFVSLIMAAIAFSSCSEDINCPAFKPYELVPEIYRKDKIVTFKNQNEELIRFEIGTLNFSDAYSYKCKDLHNICPCESSAVVYASNYGNDNMFRLLRIELNDRNNQQVYRFSIFFFSFEFDFVNDIKHIDIMDNISIIDEMEINGKQFQQVIVVTNNDEEIQTNIKKVYFNKKYGIIKFINKESENTWELVL